MNDAARRPSIAAACALATLLVAAAGARADCTPTVDAEMWTAGEARIIGVDTGVQGCTVGMLSFRAGASYYNYNDYNYSGVTAALRLQPDWIVAPYVGVGFIAGIGEQATPADRDGKDNDNDGVVDEPGEQAETVSTLFVYPEVGVSMRLGDSLALTITGKQYYGDEFTGEPIISIGMQTSVP